MSVLQIEIADRIATLVFDDPSARVNTMTAAWKEAFHAAVERLAEAAPELDGVILRSGKPGHFFAGADLKSMFRPSPEAARRFFAEIEAIKHDLRRLERLPVPVVAVIEGAALGGGLELALSCHHRICVNDPKIRLGLPEVTLGLLPGAGGLTKFVRLFGLKEALPLLLEGRTLTPAEAAQRGLVSLVDDAAALLPAARAWIAGRPEPVQPWDRKGYAIPGGGPSNPAVAQMLALAPAMLREKTQGRYPAPEAILACAVEGASVGFDTALRIESRYIAQLATGPVAQAMIGFFLDRTAAKSAGRAGPGAEFAPRKVGILGAGMMGAGIAHANAARGIACVLKDVTREKAEAGRAQAASVAARQVARGKLTEAEAAALRDRIAVTGDAADLAGCDLLIEAVFENPALKAGVIAEAAAHLAPGGVFASNTSTLPITDLARAFPDPARFIGLHFFSPVDRMELLEIIRGRGTSEETVGKALAYARLIGKTPIVVNDSRGFYTSRTFGTFVMEGAAMLAEGLPAPLIERAAVMAGMPVGPLAVLDETSLALSVHVLDATRAAAAAEGRTYRPTEGEALVERMVRELDRPGRAAGRGFYDYPKEGPKRLWPGLAATFGRPGVTADVAELGDRFLYRQALETLRCLAEGVLTSGRDANVGSVLGIGFPAWTGGAWRFVESRGLPAFLVRCRTLADRYGERFAPPDLADDWRAAA